MAQEGTAADFTSLPTDSQENTSEYVRESKESAELFEERVKGSGEEAYAAEVYATRKREPMKGQSAVSAFLAAELKAEEFKAEELEAGEIASAFRAVETGQGNEENIVELPKLKPELKLRAEPRLKSEPEPRLKSEPEPRLKSEPEPKLKPEPVREALAAAVSDSAEYDGQARSSIQRQNISKDKKPRRERPAEDTDRDVVIRRILEEFMA